MSPALLGRPVLSLRLAHSGGTAWMCGPAVPEGYSETARLQVFAAGQHGSAAPSFGAGRIFVRGGTEIAAVRLDPAAAR